MDQKLSDWAKINKKTYLQAHREYKKGKIEGAFQTAKGSILVKEVNAEINGEIDNPLNIKNVARASTRARFNASALTDDVDQFINIENGLTPFELDGDGGTFMSPRRVVKLCQKAYYNFDVFRNTIDLMTEFSVTNVRFRGGSQKSRELFDAIFKKVGIWSIQDMYYREHFRSGNTFIYRYDVEVTSKDIEKLRQVFGEDNVDQKISDIQTQLPKNKKVKLPARYIILNPSDVRAGGSIDFSSPVYYKYLTSYELERLRTPRTEEDQEVFDSLSPEDQKLVKSSTTSVMVPLDRDKIYASFYKKQSYEPFSVPMGYPVLANINAKAELRKMDVQIARTAQQAILLINLGYESKDGKYVYPKNVAQTIQELFANESVSRVLVADFTTKAQFVIPQIADILDPKKYEVLDRDINIGLNNILVGGEKFSNQSMKVQIFVERLRHAREQFKNDFLMPEIKRIAKELGLKNYPEPFFDEINLKDELEFGKLYTQLISIGVLTPEEGIKAIETGQLPNPDESLESQQKLKAFKDQRLYQPLVGGGIGDQMQLAEKMPK